jgi:hypothetical protein
MAMTSQEWTISALAVEFGMDRRTVARRIGAIAPAGEKAGAPVWRLAEVARALIGDVEGQGATGDVNEFSRMLLRLCGIIAPGRVADAAGASGFETDHVERIFTVALRAMAEVVAEVAQISRIPAPFESNHDLRGAAELWWRPVAATSKGDD